MRAWRVVLVVGSLLAAAISCSSDDGPTRILLVGDSVMNQVGPALADSYGRGVDVRNEAVYGSGLLTPQLFDWRQHLNRVLENYDPDIVIFLFVGNYNFGDGQNFETASGERITERNSQAFFDAWENQAQLLTERAAEDADTVWVLPPPMRTAEDQAVIEGLREGYEHIADETGSGTVDAFDVLAGPDGEYLPRGPGPDGEDALLRPPDGIHLAPAGAAVLARLIHDDLDL